MASNPTNALQTQLDTYDTQLGKSTTAFAPNTMPTKKDLSISSSKNAVQSKLDQIESDRVRTSYYGPNNAAGSDAAYVPPADSMTTKVLKGISRPLNAIAGTAQYAIGQGTDKTLAGSVNKSMDAGLTFGNILQQNKAPRWVSAPLGLALDIMLDPVNWVTMGTGALIPRAGIGLVKGTVKGGAKAGAEALAVGTTSNLAKKAFGVGRFTRLNNLFPETAESLATHSLQGAARYDSLIGSTVKDRVGKGILTSIAEEIPGLRNIAPKAGQTFAAVEKFATKTPTGKKVWDALKYSPGMAGRIVDQGDIAKGKLAEVGLRGVMGSAAPDFATLEEMMKEGAQVAASKSGKTLINAEGNPIMIDVMKTVENGNRVIDKEGIGRLVTIPAGYDNSRRILGGLLDAGAPKTIYDDELLQKFYRSTKSGRTGVTWYDRFLDRAETATVNDMLHGHLGDGDVEGLAKLRDAQKITAAGLKSSEPLKAGESAVEALDRAKNELVSSWNNTHTSMKNFKDWHILENFLKGERAATAAFKLAKVPLNLASHTVALLGNLVMGKMGGLPVESVAFRASLKKSLGIMTGRGGVDALGSVFLNDINSFLTMMEKNPGRFSSTFGQSAEEIMYQIEDIRRKFPGTKMPSVETLRYQAERDWKKMDKEAADVARSVALLDNNLPVTELAGKEKREALLMKTGSQSLEKLQDEGIAVEDLVKSSSWSANETLAAHDSNIEKFSKFLEKQAKENPGNISYAILNGLVNKMPRAYEHIDQGFKLATVDFLTHHGLTEAELGVVSRYVDFDFARDIEVLDDARKALRVKEYGPSAEELFVLKPLKASDVAMETFMNYSAMPDFVRIMRSLPLVGSPFYSFPYAMGAKLAKTAIHNPAVFNKIGFAMTEFSGLRTPDEKKALTEKYNAYLNSPTVVRILGMWNTDLKNVIPYYQMNMLSPSERQYDETWQGKMVEMSDKFPILQHPFGQVIKDYYLQPWLLSGTKNVPQGAFGQPIMPYYDPVTGRRKDPSELMRSGLAARTLAESFVPGTASLLGPALHGLSRDVTEALPLGFGVRSTKYASEGKTGLGVMSKEDKIRKMFRTLMARSGVPLYTLDTTKTNTNK